MTRWMSLMIVLAMTHGASADDAQCVEVAKGKLRSVGAPTVIFVSKPGGKPTGTHIKGDPTTAMAGDVVYYFAKDDTPSPADIGLCADLKIDARKVDNTPKCKGGLFTFSYRRTCAAAIPAPAPAPVPAPQAPPPVPGDMVADILNRADTDTKKMVENAGGASIAAEAVQILGQIVADRASAAAYGLLTGKAQDWLKCSDKEPLFGSTCELLKTLRLQDLAMAPDLLRGALAQDALRIVKKKTRGVVPTRSAASSSIHVVIAPQQSQPAASPPPADDGCAASNKDIRCTISRYLDDYVIPTLAKPIDALTGHSSQAMIQTLIADGRAKLKTKTLVELCALEPRAQILATAAVAFAKCKLDQPIDCAIMPVVDAINNQCTDAEKLDDYQVAYARSFAGHLWEAATLRKDSSATDEPKRLIAGLEASFEVACMYANAPAGPYECKLLAKHGEPLEPSEAVAVMREVVIAAANRDGGAVAAAIVRFLVRVLPADDDVTQRKGLRILSTISAYAATYISSEKGSEDAHDRRTALLESLTKDMTQRSDRGGDGIWSLGGSLRGVVGGRVGRTYETPSGDEKYGTALWAPLSLPLGFAYDRLWETDDKKRRGLHLEFGVIDLAQYLSWEEGFEISEPNVEDALTPSFTLGYAFGWELPMFLGVTVGYTPSFDFNSDSEDDKRGSWNIGGTLGFYVPLLDLN